MPVRCVSCAINICLFSYAYTLTLILFSSKIRSRLAPNDIDDNANDINYNIFANGGASATPANSNIINNNIPSNKNKDDDYVVDLDGLCDCDVAYEEEAAPTTVINYMTDELEHVLLDYFA